MRSGADATPGFWDALRGAGARRELQEMLDRADVDRRALAGNLAHLRLMNRWFRWSGAVAHDVECIMRARGLSTATLLDVATGSADVPRAILHRAARNGLRVEAVASDVSAAVLEAARGRGQGPASIRLVQHDATAMPFADGSFDLTLCCLAAHHFDPPALERLLRELWRVARHAVIVSDLSRSRVGYIAARMMALALRNPLTSHDGPVSVLRAYTPAELRSLAVRAGLAHIRVRQHFPARMTLVAQKGAAR